MTSNSKYKKVFLLSGLSSFINEQVSPQIGLGYLSEIIEREGIECRQYDYSLKRSYGHLFNQIKDFSPDFIGIHMMSHGYLKQFEMINNLKSAFSSTDFVVGGPHASIYRKQILNENPFISSVCFLEGEITTNYN